jgi:hypothetical protein
MRYCSTGFFALGLCYKAFCCAERCTNPRCLAPHSPLEPDELRWIGQNGGEKFIWDYIKNFFPHKVRAYNNNSRTHRLYRDVGKLANGQPPHLDLPGWKEELTGPSTNVQTDDYPGVKTFLQGGHTRLTPAEWYTCQDVIVHKYAAREWDDLEAVNAWVQLVVGEGATKPATWMHKHRHEYFNRSRI